MARISKTITFSLPPEMAQELREEDCTVIELLREAIRRRRCRQAGFDEPCPRLGVGKGIAERDAGPIAETRKGGRWVFLNLPQPPSASPSQGLGPSYHIAGSGRTD